MNKPSNSYLAWVGGSYYKTCEDFISEAKSHGVSKKLPGYGMACSLSKRDSVVWLMHDEGDSNSCESCFGDVSCPSCRTLDKKIFLWQGAIDNLKDRYFGEGIFPAGKQRIVKIRRRRIAGARAQKLACKDCNGLGVFACGTGGSAWVDGRKIDYREYKWMIKQPILFRGVFTMDVKRCEDCAGTGKHPGSKLFGFFAPKIEYVMSGKESEVQLEQIKDFKCVSVDKERLRPSGKRKTGFYAVTTRRDKPTIRARNLADQLVPFKSVDIIGDFVSFYPVEMYGEKRFRGLKRFSSTGFV